MCGIKSIFPGGREHTCYKIKPFKERLNQMYGFFVAQEILLVG